MQQILIIHGGDSYDTYEEYLQYLYDKTYSLDRLRGSDWKSSLQEKLGPDFDVLRASMPNKDNAKYAEWKIVMDKIAPLLSDEIILIGHSLGGLFLAKYLHENNFPKKIKATMLIAAPFSTTEHEPITDFTFTLPLTQFAKQGGLIYLFHSDDDPVVPFSDVTLYSNHLQNATSITLSNKGHINQSEFPELMNTLKKLLSHNHPFHK